VRNGVAQVRHVGGRVSQLQQRACGAARPYDRVSQTLRECATESFGRETCNRQGKWEPQSRIGLGVWGGTEADAGVVAEAEPVET
jgi:hypothetical protein